MLKILTSQAQAVKNKVNTMKRNRNQREYDTQDLQWFGNICLHQFLKANSTLSSFLESPIFPLTGRNLEILGLIWWSLINVDLDIQV